MDKISILAHVKTTGGYTLQYRIAVPVPEHFKTGVNKELVLQSYKLLYPSLVGVEVDYVIFVEERAFTYDKTPEEVKATLEMAYMTFEAGVNSLQILVPDELNGLAWNGTDWS